MTHSRPLRLLVLTMLAVSAGVLLSGPAAASTGCDLYASPSGSDSASGQLGSPLATVQALDQALAPGQTGCLLSGTFGSTSTVHRLTTNGTAAQQITITTAPGQTAEVVGLVELEGSYTTLSNLQIDGSNDRYDIQRDGTSCPYPVSNGLEIDGHDDIFENNDYYQSIPSLRGNGIGIGWNAPANNTIVRDNRIHDVGQCRAEDHLIYLDNGNNVQIYDNWMWNDPHGWGVQLYPHATNADIHDNVIDAAGSGFVIAGTSSGNTINHNIVMNSTGLPAASLTGVAISTSGPIQPGNSFTNNLSYNNPGGISSTSGITLANNTTTTKPNLANPQNHDYRPTTTLTTWNLWNGGLAPLTTATAPTAPAATTASSNPPRPGGGQSSTVGRSRPTKVSAKKSAAGSKRKGVNKACARRSCARKHRAVKSRTKHPRHGKRTHRHQTAKHHRGRVKHPVTKARRHRPRHHRIAHRGAGRA